MNPSSVNAHTLDQPLKQQPPKKLKQRLVISALVIFITLVTLVVLDGQLTRWYLIHWFAQHGVALEIKALRLNLWDGSLAVENFSATEADGRRLSVADLQVSWLWQPLYDKTLTIDQVKIQGLQLDIAGDHFAPRWLGPLDLSQFKSEPTPTAPEPASQPWLIDIGPIALVDFDVCYSDATVRYVDLGLPIKIADQLLTNCVQWQQLRLDSQLTTDAKGQMAFKGDISLNQLHSQDWLELDKFSVKGFTFANQLLGWGAIELGQLKVLPSSTVADQQLDLTALRIGPSTVNLTDLSVNVDQVLVTEFTASSAPTAKMPDRLALARLSIASISHQQDQVQLGPLGLSQLQVAQGSQPLAELAQLDVAAATIDIQAQRANISQLGLSDLSAWQLANDQQFHRALSLGQFKLSKANLAATDQHIEGIALTELRLLEDLQAADHQDQGSGSLLTVKTFTLDTVDVEQDIRLGQLSVDGLESLLEYRPQSGLNVTQWFAPAPKPDGTDANANASPSKQIAIAQLHLGEQTKIIIIDHSLDKPQVHELSQLKLTMVPITVGQNVKPTQVELTSLINGSGVLQTKGQMILDPAALVVDLTGKLAHLPLTHYSPYSARNIGYRINQGQLILDFKVKIANNQIDSNFDLVLNKFEISDVPAYEKDAQDQALGIPVPLALNLLRDNDNNIALSLPITGDLNKPDFSIASVVSIVTYKALKTAVIYTYSPLGILSLAGSIVDLATALRFKSIDFAPGFVELDQNANAQLDKVGQVLSQKSQVGLVLCANATQLDLPPPPVVATEVQPAVPAQPPLTPAETAHLLALAKQRQLNAQTYLVNKYGIEVHRLQLCNVQLDAKASAIPVVAISL